MMPSRNASTVESTSAIARPFRFGVWLKSLESAKTCAELAQTAERLGYSTIFVGEHLDTGYGSFAMASAIASATSRSRVGTLMLLNDLRHPAILAKEAATVDVLSEGRLELGIGAGQLQGLDAIAIGDRGGRAPPPVRQRERGLTDQRDENGNQQVW